jgi:hypothetical protein
MLKIVLQPEERATLLVIREGLYPPGRAADTMVLRLMALRMLEGDANGNPKITALAEAALAGAGGTLH